MSVFKLYNIIDDNKAHECNQLYVKERDIQNFVEMNLEYLFNIRLLKSEFSFIANDGGNGRMDTLGLDENNCPVVIEYKNNSKDNIINQGLFYVDWLKSHQKDFEWIILEKIDKETAKSIDWSQTRLICIATDFNRYDKFAIHQCKVNVELVTYSRFENQILFNFTNVSSTKKNEELTFNNTECIEKLNSNTLDTIPKAYNKFENANTIVKLIFKEFEDYIFSLSDNIQKNVLIHYIAYKNIKNVACVELFKNNLKLFLSINPEQQYMKKNLKMRDVTSIGHRGTGNLEITINSLEDLESIKDLIKISVQKN